MSTAALITDKVRALAVLALSGIAYQHLLWRWRHQQSWVSDWVSEQFLNGTSAQNRLCTAKLTMSQIPNGYAPDVSLKLKMYQTSFGDPAKRAKLLILLPLMLGISVCGSSILGTHSSLIRSRYHHFSSYKLNTGWAAVKTKLLPHYDSNLSWHTVRYKRCLLAYQLTYLVIIGNEMFQLQKDGLENVYRESFHSDVVRSCRKYSDDWIHPDWLDICTACHQPGPSTNTYNTTQPKWLPTKTTSTTFDVHNNNTL